MIVVAVILTIVSGFIFYLIIKAAINQSEISKAGSDIRALQAQLNKQHKELISQIEQLRLAISDANKGHNFDKSL